MRFNQSTVDAHRNGDCDAASCPLCEIENEVEADACDWGGCDRPPLAGAFCNFHADEYERVVAERGKEWADD